MRTLLKPFLLRSCGGLACGVATFVPLAGLAITELPWGNSFFQAQTAMGNFAVLGAILLAGLMAQTGSTLLSRNGRVDTLTAVRPLRGFALVAGLPVLSTLCGVMAAMIVAAVPVLGNGGTLSSPLPAFQVALLLSLAIVIGATAGAVTQVRFSAPLAVTATMACIGATLFFGSEALFIGPANYPLDGRAASLTYFGSAILGGAAAAIATTVFATSGSVIVRRLALASIVVVLVGVGLIPKAPLKNQPGPTLCLQSEATAVSGVEICYYPGYAAFARQATTAVNELMAASEAAGVPPASWPQRMWLGGDPESLPPQGTTWIYLGAEGLRDGRLGPLKLASSLGRAAWCAEMMAVDTPPPLLEQGDEIAGWLLHETGNLSDELFTADHPELAALPAAKQASRVQALLAAQRSCRSALPAGAQVPVR